MAEIDIIMAIVLGIIQGISEWLPVSSSGQSILAMVDVMGIDPDSALSFAFYLHFGTLLAVLLKLRRDVKKVIVSLPRVKEDKLVQFMIISTIVTGLVGIPIYLFLRDVFKGGAGGEIITALVGFFLLITGIILYIYQKRSGYRGIKESNGTDSILAGAAQGFAVIPGLSRSGVTIAALIGRNIRQEEALRLSFLMSIPATIGVIILEIVRGPPSSIGPVPIIAGIIAAFIVGYLVIEGLLRFAKNVRFDVFCMVFGVIAILVAALVLL